MTIAKLLLATPTTTSLDARVVVENNSNRDVRAKVRVDPGPGSGGRPALLDVAVPAGGVAVPSVTIALSAPLWSPESPTTLTARATMRGEVSDTLSSSYGVRTVSVAAAEFRLNGEPVFFKGVNWHEETDTSGRSMSRAEYDDELGRLVDLGASFLRHAVYSRHPYAYDWTDRHGVMVLDEWDSMWIPTEHQEVQLTYGLSAALAAQTAWNNHNHPSVIMWGLENESTTGTAIYREWITQMKAAVNAVDLVARPVTWAPKIRAENADLDLADGIGMNEYYGYFYGESPELGPALDALHARYPDKPVLITENGAWSWPLGNRGEPTVKGTEDWHAGILTSHWAQVVERDFMAGYAFWVPQGLQAAGELQHEAERHVRDGADRLGRPVRPARVREVQGRAPTPLR